MTTPIAVIDKNSREVVRIAWDTYEGHQFVDCRVYYRDGDELKPTRKGLAIPPRLIDDVAAALIEAGRRRP